MIPNTYLLCAPSDAGDPFGRMLTHTQVIARLRSANPNIHAPESWHTWGKDITSIWVGVPLQRGSYKISGIRKGAVPEFTQVDPSGLVTLGWRAIVDKAIRARAISRPVAERLFNYTSGTSGKDGNCVACRKQGKITKATSKGSLCNDHASMTKQIAQHADLMSAMRYHQRRKA